MDLAPLIYIIFSITIFEFFAISGILFLKKNENIPGAKFLAIVLFCFALISLKEFAFCNWEYQNYATLHKPILLIFLVGFVTGPLSFFYTRSTVGNQISLKYKLIHLLPLVIVLIVVLVTIIDHKVLILWWSPLYKPLTLSMCVSNIIYVGVSVNELRKSNFQFPLLNNKNKQKVNSFIYYFFLATLVYWIFKLTTTLVLNSADIKDEVYWTYEFIIVRLIMFVPLNIFVVLWMGNKELLMTQNRKICDFIDKKDTNEIILQIKRVLEKEHQYKDSELTLVKLAGILKLHPRYLSHIINNELEKSFSDLINTYRIKESAKLLIIEPDKTIQEIMFEVGFNSKSTFNTLFKSETGLTPKEFRLKNIGQVQKILN